MEHDLQLLAVGLRDRFDSGDANTQPAHRRIARDEVGRARDERSKIHRLGPQHPRPRKDEQVLHDTVQRIEPRDDVRDDRPIARFGGHARRDDLQRAADAGNRVLDLVRDDRRHLPEARERRLLAQQLSSVRLRSVIS